MSPVDMAVIPSWVLKGEYLPPVEFSRGNPPPFVPLETLRASNCPIEFCRVGLLNEGLPKIFLYDPVELQTMNGRDFVRSDLTIF